MSDGSTETIIANSLQETFEIMHQFQNSHKLQIILEGKFKYKSLQSILCRFQIERYSTVDICRDISFSSSNQGNFLLRL